MGKVELLAPAGDYECFLAALHAGADAVYIGGQKFGARAFAGNFSDEEVCRAISYAKLFGKKVYLTVNTLLKDTEMRELVSYLIPFYEAGLAGIIVQDMGVFSVCREHFPEMELHASTQMTITDTRGAARLKELGASRFVPARELSLEEIREIKQKVPMEVEAFIHGALCYCYSGQCLFSSMLGGRSGNRGRCAQTCRLPYQVEENGRKVLSGEKYPLSLKDLCTIEFLPALIEAGIDSFKIEGRMKKPEYVAGVTAVYRKYIDKYQKEKPEKWVISREDQELLRHLYIRTEVQDGYYYRHNGKEMVTLDKPGYAGCSEEVLERIRTQIMGSKLYVPVSMKAVLKAGEPAELSVCANGISVKEKGMEVARAQKKPLEEEGVRKQFLKTGGTAFQVENFTIDMEDDIFLPVGAMNELRRKALEELEHRLAPGRSYRSSETKEEEDFSGKESRHLTQEPETFGKIVSVPALHARATDCGQAAVLIPDERMKRVYLSSDSLFLEREQKSGIANIKELAVKRKEKDSQFEFFLSLPPVLRNYSDRYLAMLQEWLLKEGDFVDGIQAASLSGREWLKEIGWKKKTALDARIYVWNQETFRFWNPDMDTYTAPLELNRKAIYSLPSEKKEVMIYGRIPMMTAAGCLRKTAGLCQKKQDCSTLAQGIPRKNFEISLVDRYQAKLPVLTNCLHCMNIIYNAVPLSLHNFMGELTKQKIPALLLDFTDETPELVKEISEYFGALSEGRGQEKEIPFTEFTTGHFKKGAE